LSLVHAKPQADAMSLSMVNGIVVSIVLNRKRMERQPKKDDEKNRKRMENQQAQ
jgi:hypothetical protein